MDMWGWAFPKSAPLRSFSLFCTQRLAIHQICQPISLWFQKCLLPTSINRNSRWIYSCGSCDVLFPHSFRSLMCLRKVTSFYFPHFLLFPRSRMTAFLVACVLPMKENQSFFQFCMTSLNYEANESNGAPGKWKQPLCWMKCIACFSNT